MAQSPQRLVNLSGTPKQFSASANTIPGTEQTLISQVLASDIKLTRAVVSCTQDGILRIKDDGNVIGVARIASGVVDAAFDWVPYLDALSGHTITVTFEAASYGQAVTCDAFLQYLEQ